MRLALFLLAAWPAAAGSIWFSALGEGFEIGPYSTSIGGPGVPFEFLPTRLQPPAWGYPPFYSGDFFLEFDEPVTGAPVRVTGAVFEHEAVGGPAFIPGPVIATHPVNLIGTLHVHLAARGYWGMGISIDEEQTAQIPEPNGLALLAATLAGVAVLAVRGRQSARARW
jgi:hypothetical protein